MAEKPRHRHENENKSKHTALDKDTTPPLSSSSSEKRPLIPSPSDSLPVSSIQDSAIREVSSSSAASANTPPSVINANQLSTEASTPPSPNISNASFDDIQAQNTREHYLHDNYYPYLYHDEWYVDEEYYRDSTSQNYLHDNYYPHVYHDEWYQQSYDYQDSHPAAPFVGPAPGGGAAPFVASATPFFAAAAVGSFEDPQRTAPTEPPNTRIASSFDTDIPSVQISAKAVENSHITSNTPSAQYILEQTPTFEPGIPSAQVSAKVVENSLVAPNTETETGLESVPSQPSPSSPLDTAHMTFGPVPQLYPTDLPFTSPPLYTSDTFSPLTPSGSLTAAPTTEPPAYLQPSYIALQSDVFPVVSDGILIDSPAQPIQHAHASGFFQEGLLSSHAPQISAADQVRPLPIHEQSVQPLQIQEQPGTALPEQSLLQYEPWNELQPSFIEHRDELQQPYAAAYAQEDVPSDSSILFAPSAQQELIGNQAADSLIWDAYATEGGLLHTSRLGSTQFLIQDTALDNTGEGSGQSLAWSIVNVSDASQPQVLLQGESASLSQAKADLLVQSQTYGFLETERIESYLATSASMPERINQSGFLTAPHNKDVALHNGSDVEARIAQNNNKTNVINTDTEAECFVSQSGDDLFFMNKNAESSVPLTADNMLLANILPRDPTSYEPWSISNNTDPFFPLSVAKNPLSQNTALDLLGNESPLLITESQESFVSGNAKAALIENTPPLLEHSSGVFGLIDKEHKANPQLSDNSKQSIKEKLSKAGSVAAAGTLGVLGLASNMAKKTAAYTGEAAITGVNQILREDEDLAKLANSSDVVRDAVSTEITRHAKQVKRREARDFLVKTRAENKQILLDDARDSFKEAATPTDASVFEMAVPTQSETERITTLKHSNDDLLLPDKDETIEQSIMPKKETASTIQEGKKAKSDGTILKNKQDKEDLLDANRKSSGVESVDLDKKQLGIKQRDGKKPGSKKNKEPLARKQSASKEALTKKAASDKTSSDLVLKDPRLGGVEGLVGGVAGTALAATNIAKDSTLRVIASENEQIAIMLSAVDKGKKAYQNAKRIVRIPVKVYRAVRAGAHAIYRAGAAIWKALGAVVAAGWPAVLCLLGLFFVVIAVVVILLGTATIINDNQETSEVAALVAELDAELTEEIRSKGAAPVLYADGRDTYLEEDGQGGFLTIDVDLSDEESDLETVSASTITVQTNPDEIIAYIDARYGGEWQVGAASWKYTVDAFGKTWTIFDWDGVPEWVQKGLNKIGKADFALSLQMELEHYLGSEIEGIDPDLVQEIADDVSDQIADVVYDGQVSDMSEELLIQIMRDTVKKHQGELELSDEALTKVYYEMLGSITEMVGEEEPVALVYDEIVLLHERMNFWSEDYESIPTSGGAVGGQTSSGASTTTNASGYPNTNGYDAAELANWDGYNEVSRYGIGEPGTTAVLGDGTQITNTWSDTTMAIACEGKQNNLYAYWTKAYRDNTGISDPVPVRITLFNPQTNMSITVEVRDCGGWRGFNERYEGLNQDRQWDLLPAVWRALGGTESSGLMNVYWKVESGAGTAGSLAPVTIEGYPWPAETDAEDGNIEINLPAYVPHGIQDVLNNEPLLEKLLDREAFASEREYKMAYNTVYGKVRTIMRALLTQTNAQGTVFIDYFYLSRDLGNPFGKDENRRQHQWVVTHRYNPGYENFDHDEAYVTIKPITGATSVYTVSKGVVTDVSEGSITISRELDTTTDAVFVYSGLKDIKVEEDDELKRGATIGSLSGSELTIAYYETETKNLITFNRDWAYAASLFMDGFAGYEEPDAPSAYTGTGTRSYEDCETIIEFAQSRLGCPYVWGATGPNTFDCSGLTQWCYAQTGISIPRTSAEQYAAAATQGGIVPLDESLLQPGDILWKTGHVAIYIGNNQYIHAPQTGDVVKISTGIDYFTCGLSIAN